MDWCGLGSMLVYFFFVPYISHVYIMYIYVHVYYVSLYLFVYAIAYVYAYVYICMHMYMYPIIQPYLLVPHEKIPMISPMYVG